VDCLQAQLQEYVTRSAADGLSRKDVFRAIWRIAHAAAGRDAPDLDSNLGHPIAHLSEPWYCCAEPTDQQLQSF
jgi:hypothetical protein